VYARIDFRNKEIEFSAQPTVGKSQGAALEQAAQAKDKRAACVNY
jgi:hypothetical protein